MKHSNVAMLSDLYVCGGICQNLNKPKKKIIFFLIQAYRDASRDLH
jgi:hypothetical protein